MTNNSTPTALLAAFFTTTMTILFQIFVETRRNTNAKQSIAGALAAELSMYAELAKPMEIASTLRQLINTPRAERQKAFRLLGDSKLPEGHPVFDQVADKIGLLAPEIAVSVARVYNVVTSMRLLLVGLGVETFVNAADETHIARLRLMAEGIEREFDNARFLVDRLNRTAAPLFGKL